LIDAFIQSEGVLLLNIKMELEYAYTNLTSNNIHLVIFK